MNEFERARLERIDDNMKITAVELMKLLIADIESGKVKIDGIVILTALRPDNGRWEFETRRAGMTRDQELVALTMAKDRCIRNWLLT